MAPRADFSDATKLIGATEAEVSILIGIHHVVQFGQWHSSTLGSGDGRRQKKKTWTTRSMINEDVAIRLRRLLLRGHHLSNKDKS